MVKGYTTDTTHDGVAPATFGNVPALSAVVQTSEPVLMPGFTLNDAKPPLVYWTLGLTRVVKLPLVRMNVTE